MGRNPCCSKEGLNRGAWTAMEDKILKEYVRIHGEGKWRSVPKRAGLKRCGKSCRLRWLNYLRPDIKRGNISNDEEELIIRLHRLLGNRWSLIAGRLPGRTDNEIKNYWNTNIGKKVQGHSNPTFKQRPSNQARGNLIPAKELATSAAPPKAIIGSGVIRTKATRCTKVVLTSGPQDQTSDDHDHQLDIKPHDHGHKPSITLGDHHEDSADFSKLNLEENINLSNFLEDFEMDENFLSDFLDTDFSQLPCFESSVGDSIITNCTSGDKDQTSLTCHQRRTTSSTLLVPEEETMHGSDFHPMAPLTESELDWI